MFKTVEDFLAQTGPGSPTKAERALITHCRAGTYCVFSETRPIFPTDANTIRAALLRLLLLGGTPACGLHESGVCVAGAWITDNLDMGFCIARGQTTMNACHFVEEPLFTSSRLQLLSLEGSSLPGLYAQGVMVEGSVYLRDVKAIGTVAINGAKIGGQLDCTGATFDGAGSAALHAQSVTCGGSMLLRNLSALGTVFLNSAKITGQLNCNGANLNGAGGVALNADGADCKRNLLLCDLTAIGTVRLAGTNITGQLEFTGASLNGTGVEAIFAQRMLVSAGFMFRSLNSVSGQIDLTAAHVGDLVDDRASWPTQVNDLLLDGFTYERISGSAPVTLSARRDWLALGSLVNHDFRPQPYTQFACVLRQMGHGVESRRVIIERTRLQGKVNRTARHIQPNGDVSVAFLSLWADLRNLLHFCLDRIFFWVAGYGQDAARSLYWLMALFLGATLLAHFTWEEGSFAPNSDVVLTSAAWQERLMADCIPAARPGCDANPAETWANDPASGIDWDSFNHYAYAADLVVPILDLGQTQAWVPSKDRGPWGKRLWWMRWVLAAAGWIVTGLGVAAVTGVMQRNQPD